MKKNQEVGVASLSVKQASGDGKQGQPRVLIADDDLSFLETTSAILKDQGYDTYTVSDAQSAETAIRTTPFDLLIADINMPGNEDLSLLDHIKQQAADIPVILVTGMPTVDTAVKSVGLNVSSYIVKPFDISHLLEEVEKAVKLSVLRHSIDGSMSGLLNITDQLAELREQLSQTNQPNLAEASNNYMSMLVTGIIDSLSNGASTLNQLESGRIEDSGARSNHMSSVKSIQNPENSDMLVTAIKETISTLEKTKSSFKSKELGSLRKKLNVALQAIDYKETV